VHRLKRIFSSGIEEVKGLILQHLELSRTSLEILQKTISSGNYDKSLVDEEVRRVTALEREGDEIIRDLVDRVVQGAVIPTITNVMIVLLDNVDNVLDMIYFAMKEIRRGLHLWSRDEVRSIVSTELKEMLNLVKTMLDYLNNMLKSEKDEELRKYTRLISSLEEEIDEVKEDILDKVYTIDFTAAEFNHIVTLVYTVDKIADNIQDASFHLATVVTSH